MLSGRARHGRGINVFICTGIIIARNAGDVGPLAAMIRNGQPLLTGNHNERRNATTNPRDAN